MELLINVLLVASPFIGMLVGVLVLYAFIGHKYIKAKALLWVGLAILALFLITLVNSPLVRPVTTDIPDQGIVKQLEAEASQVGSVKDLVLKDATPVTEVRTKDEGPFVPKLSSDK